MTAFVLVNQCSDAALTPELLARIAAALEVQLNRDVATWWGGAYRCRAATPDNAPAPGDVVALVVDTLPDAPGAVAYHDWRGEPVIYAARSMCSNLSGGSLSLSQALSHELCETVGDVGCNLWADSGTGDEWAHELCDAVEGGWYPIQGIAVADFVLPTFFDAGDTSGRYSFCNEAPAPFTLSPGGYTVRRTAAADETQQTARRALDVSVTLTIPFGLRARKKAHWSSRTFRRGARVQP